MESIVRNRVASFLSLDPSRRGRTRGDRVAAVLACAVFAAAMVSAEVMTSVRSFRLQHRSVAEASQLVQPMLSEDGRLTVEPRRSVLTVQDVPEVVEAVSRMLHEFDREVSQARIVIRLFQASADEQGGSDSMPGSDTDIPAELMENLSRVFEASSYRQLGAAEVNAEFGEVVHAALGKRYLIQFLCLSDATRFGHEAVDRQRLLHAQQGPGATPREQANADEQTGRPRISVPSLALTRNRYRLQHLTLYRLDPQTGDELSVLQTSVALSPEQRVVLSASASEESRQGLVLVLENVTDRNPL